jgi:hypothetical protein
MGVMPSRKNCSLPQPARARPLLKSSRKAIAMSLAVKIEPAARRLGTVRVPEVARDFAALFGAAVGVGVAVSVGLMLAVIGLA